MRSYGNSESPGSPAHYFERSGPLGRSGRLYGNQALGKAKTAFLTNFQTFLNFSWKKNHWNFKIFFSKLVHRKGCFGKIKKNRFFVTDFRFSKNSGGFS